MSQKETTVSGVPHNQGIEEVFAAVNSTAEGLKTEDAQKRLGQYGKNELVEAPKKPMIKRIWEQISDPMVLILLAAGIVSGVFKEYADCAIILAIIVLNAILGIVQESKAEQAVEALKKMSVSTSKIKRNGAVVPLPSAEIVTGDIVILEAGDSVPADLRLIESASLRIEEAVLTGESVPAEKNIDTLDKADIPLGDRVNMAYMGTSVAYGRGVGVVVKTGMNTEMGNIAKALSNTTEEKTPLQKALAKLGKTLSVAVLGICVLIFIVGILKFGKDQIFESFLTAVSLAVAAIPEGLVVVVTVLLSLGVKKMSEKNAIIRKLTAVETLGCTQVICSDKTGTLTQNKMTVVEHCGEEKLLKKIMYLCNDSKVKGEKPIGDPTEIALKIFGLETVKVQRSAELPFDSDRKLMSTFHTEDGNIFQYTKGAPDQVLDRCTFIIENGEVNDMTPKKREEILTQNKAFADRALRVIAGAYAAYSAMPEKITTENCEKNLVFVGLTGMIDPIRPEVKVAVEECLQAGIKPVMITGDHRDTAVAIGKELGLINNAAESLTGAELDKLSDSDYNCENYSVYARVSPDNKIRIVNAWKAKGRVTAMTGDGVNDAPSIKAADIGIGMGITGTDVTKNVADMVLVDDNFATIVTAVGEGRKIFENIRKAVQFLLSSNLAEVLSILFATLSGFVLFKPIHLLWINLVTDTFPAMALGNEPAEGDIMRKPPRKANASIFSDGLGIDVIWQGLLIGVLVVASYLMGDAYSHDVAMTMAFVTLSMTEVFHSLNMRSRKTSIFKLKKLNPMMLGAMTLSTVLSLGIVFIPKVNTLFGLVPLNLECFAIALIFALIIIPVVEIKKALTA